ncbi:histidine kinase [Streptomyces sp. TLI_053]|uniref:sensor histidine kinase n=1 Tax=Streptomyces sp. TLI_053 TaxID=1855352 RepID=UPI001E536B28|nr:histidine kinase [Streptomyces sp. TLI_053]
MDALLVAIAAATSWIHALATKRHELDPHLSFAELDQTLVVTGSAVALLLFLRRRFPVPVFVLSLVYMAVAERYDAPTVLVALSTVAEGSLRRGVVGALLYLGVAMSCQFWALPETVSHHSVVGPEHLWRVPPPAMAAFAAVAVGRLLAIRAGLTRSMADLHEAQEHRRELHAQAVLGRERAQLAREMHDVVSHQVSLIAVRAGALQVGADNADTEEAARTIRKLSVTTLDELRHMVTLLRASGGRNSEITPQPTAEQLAELVAGSGLDARLVGEVPADASAAVQRTVYRIVQEALTNIRKHAPGASAVVEIHRSGPGLEVSVVNTAPTRPGLQLPSSRHGLIGLRERAENLDGALTSGPAPDGGYRVHVALPDYRK